MRVTYDNIGYYMLPQSMRITYHNIGYYMSPHNRACALPITTFVTTCRHRTECGVIAFWCFTAGYVIGSVTCPHITPPFGWYDVTVGPTSSFVTPIAPARDVVTSIVILCSVSPVTEPCVFLRNNAPWRLDCKS